MKWAPLEAGASASTLLLAMQQMTGAITTLTATLADRQNARARDSEFIKAGRSNCRANVLLVTAGLGIVGGIGVMVFGHVDGNTAVGGCIIVTVL